MCQVLNIKEVSPKPFKMLLNTINLMNFKLAFDGIFIIFFKGGLRTNLILFLPKVLPVLIEALPLAATVTTDFTEPADFPKSQSCSQIGLFN